MWNLIASQTPLYNLYSLFKCEFCQILSKFLEQSLRHLRRLFTFPFKVNTDKSCHIFPKYRCSTQACAHAEIMRYDKSRIIICAPSVVQHPKNTRCWGSWNSAQATLAGRHLSKVECRSFLLLSWSNSGVTCPIHAQDSLGFSSHKQDKSK